MSDSPLADWLRAREQDQRHGVTEDGGAAARQERADQRRVASPSDAAGPGFAHAAAPGPVRPPAAPWDDEDSQPDRRSTSRRRWLLFAVALVPWLVAGVALAVLAGDEHAASPRSSVDGRPAAGDGDAGQPLVVDNPAPETVPSGYAAAAVLAVRTALSSSTGGKGGDDSPQRRYVDLAVAEGVTMVGDAAVVTVAATVLEGTGERWQRSRRARFAVPVRATGEGPVVLGQPWPLPRPEAADEPDWREASLDAGPVQAALAEAGYRQVGGVRLSRSDDVPMVLRVECEAIGPGERAVRRHAVWLARGPTPTVLGELQPDLGRDTNKGGPPTG